MKSFGAIFIVIVVAIVAVFGFLWWNSAPILSVNPAAGPVSAMKTVAVKLDGPTGGLKSLTVTAIQGGKKVDVLVRSYRSGVRKAAEAVSLAGANLKDGPLTLQLAATGSAFIGGRTTVQSHSFTYDNTPPAITILSVAHNIIRGGAGLVVYSVSKEVEKTGVTFADRFVPGYRQGRDTYACLFPMPYNMDPQLFVPKVVAVDRAGNERTSMINYHLIIKPFSTDTIKLTDQFLDKINGEFRSKYPEAKTPLDLFLKVNREVRVQNVKALYDYARQSSPAPLWEGTFLRMPNTAPLGGFAQARTYLYQGQTVDQQTHLGFDLASVAHAPVPAANNGKVVYAGDFGIYGHCIIIDHGLGLQTLYAHLGQVGVKAGDTVTKGQIIANTDATGMAAGDHLHFGVVIAGQEVSPVEWWDAHWIRDNISSKLDLVRQKPAGEKSGSGSTVR